jgi:hypothetical protein
MQSSLKSEALRGLIGASATIRLDVVARWDRAEALVGSLQVRPAEYRHLLELAGRHDDAGYRIASAGLMDEILGRIGILCLAGVPPERELYLRPKPMRIRLQDGQGRHARLVEAWLAHHGGLCLHFGGAGPHFPVDGPGAAAFLRSLHDAATGRTRMAELWDGATIERGQASVLCHFLDGIGMHVPAR